MRSATLAMGSLRAAVGFLVFHIGFVMKRAGEPTWFFGLLAISNSLDQDYLPYEPITLTKMAGAILVMAGVGVAVTARRKEQ